MRKFKRRITVVDRQLQYSLALKLTSVMVGIATLYAVGIYFLATPESFEKLNADETRMFFLELNAIYFALATGILFTLALVLTNRVAGAALVIERAIRGMLNGDYEQRLALRKRDYLKPLSATIMAWRDHLQTKEQTQNECVASLESCLAEGDVDAAKELVQRLKGTLEDTWQDEEEPAETPDEEPVGA